MFSLLQIKCKPIPASMFKTAIINSELLGLDLVGPFEFLTESDRRAIHFTKLFW